VQTLECIAKPTTEPLSLGYVKAELRIDDSDGDFGLLSKIKAAREEAEKVTGRALISQTWKLTMSHFPGGPFSSQLVGRHNIEHLILRPHFHPHEIRLPKSPVNTAAVQYLDPSNQLQTLDVSKYLLMKDLDDAWLVPVANTCWPATYPQANAVRITLVCGYGDDLSDIPESIKIGMLVLIGHWNENREDWILASGRTAAYQIPFGAKHLFRGVSARRY
jgi:hypothetical protein